MQCKLCPNCGAMISEDYCSCGWVGVPKLITVRDLLGKHINNPELNEETLKNLNALSAKVNSLFYELGIKELVVTSGWRPSAYNLKIGGAKRSRHLIGCAVDLADKSGELYNLCAANLVKLAKRDMAIEDRRYTPTWLHIQFPPPRSGNRIFIPYPGPPKV